MSLVSNTLNLLKWPAGALSALMLPATVMTLIKLIFILIGELDAMLWFLLGMIGYGVSDRLLFRRRFMGSYFSTFEHELTHAIFAWLSLHRVRNLKVTWSQGGMIEIIGGSNWMIYLAPYWFPTLCIPLMVAQVIGLAAPGGWLTPALGATYCYHLISTWRETHSQQTDLRAVGFSFAWLFLPTANLIMMGAVCAFAYGGGVGAWRFLSAVMRAFTDHVSMAL